MSFPDEGTAVTENMDESKSVSRSHTRLRWILLALAVLLTVVWLFLTPDGILGKADAVGYAVCHRISVRAYHIHDRPMPLCARCSGMFLGALLGMVYQFSQGKKGKMPPFPAFVLFGLMALAWALDGVNSFLMLTPMVDAVYETTNLTRLITGTGMGLAVSAVLYPAFIQTMFNTWKDDSALGNYRQVGGLILLAALVDVLVVVEIPWVLYVLALLSAAGVLGLLMTVYSMVFVMIAKLENTYSQFRQLVNPILAGYLIALAQIGAIDLFRYLWTGTWSGFSL
jgi:uncharacterized membrane protein